MCIRNSVVALRQFRVPSAVLPLSLSTHRCDTRTTSLFFFQRIPLMRQSMEPVEHPLFFEQVWGHVLSGARSRTGTI